MAENTHSSESTATFHVTPLSTYFAIFASLMVLTAMTTWIAFIDLGALNTPVALAIAVTKATLVVLYFMHVRHSPALTTVIIVASLLWLAVLFALTFADYLSRHWPTM